MGETSVRELRIRLEHGEAPPLDAVTELAKIALEAATRADRLEACRLLGDLAGRALGADWDIAERAAFALLEAARVADTAAERRGVLAAMGRGFRNLWLLPFVHRRLSDRDESIAIAAIHAAGGLGVLPVLRRLARHDDAEIRIAASQASRALKAERSRDAAERFLIALSESDRAVRAVLARRLRTLPVAVVIEQAELLLGEDAA